MLAAGIWGPKVARLAGVRLPLVPVLHQYAVTEPLPELAGETREVVHPILRHQDADLYFRQVGDAYGIGNYDHEPRLVEPWEIAAPGGPGQPSMLPFTPEDFARAAAETGRLLPAVGRAPLARSFDGLMSFTPDGMPLIGEAAAARGLWLCEAIWVTHAGGAGRALAELIVRGDVRTDLHECDPQRFDTHGLSRDLRAAARRAAVPRGLRRAAPAPAAGAGPAAAPDAAAPAPARARRALLRERRLGAAAVVRGQRGARSRRRAPAPRLAGARLVADRRRRAPRLPRAGRPVRPDAVHEGRGPRPGRARLPPGPRGERRRPPGRDDRLHRDVRAARRDHVRPHDHAHRRRRRSSSSRAARSGATTSRG